MTPTTSPTTAIGFVNISVSLSAADQEQLSCPCGTERAQAGRRGPLVPRPGGRETTMLGRALFSDPERRVRHPEGRGAGSQDRSADYLANRS